LFCILGVFANVNIADYVVRYSAEYLFYRIVCYMNISIVLSAMLFVVAVISGVGPQSLLIIGHGVRRNHAFWVACSCMFADLVLILAAGYGLAATDSSILILWINIFGLLFVGWYLYSKITGLFQSHELKLSQENLTKSNAILRALAITFLNPLVLVDTVVIIGGNSLHYKGLDHRSFMLGAVLGDLIWVMGIAYLSYKLANKLNNKYFWIIMDLVTIVIMVIVFTRIVSFLASHV